MPNFVTLEIREAIRQAIDEEMTRDPRSRCVGARILSPV